MKTVQKVKEVKTDEISSGKDKRPSISKSLRDAKRTKINIIEIEISIEEIMKILEGLKSVYLVVGKERGVHVHRELTVLMKK